MKKTILLLLVFAVVVTAAGCILCYASDSCLINFTKPLKGSGHAVTRTIALPPFNEVEASRTVKVILIGSGSHEAIITADDNVIDHVFVRVEGKELKVGIDPQVGSVSNIDVTVSISTDGQIRSLEASSASEITGDILLTGPKLEMEASSAAKIRVKADVTKCTADASSAAVIVSEVRASEFEAEATSAAKIELTGGAGRGEIETTSAGKFDSPDFTIADCRVSASSGSKAVVHCTRTIDAHASSGASIVYSGECTGNTRSSSGGSVRKR